MSKKIEVTTVLRRLERIGATVNGNPRWKLWTDDGMRLLQSDANIGFALDNPEYRAMIDHKVTLKVTKAGRVYDVRLADDVAAL